MLICAVGFGAGGVLGAIAASTWSNNYVADQNLLLFSSVFTETRDDIAATAVSYTIYLELHRFFPILITCTIRFI